MFITNRLKFSECFAIYNYNVLEYPGELLNLTSFEIHPMKMVDTCSINEDNIVFSF